MNNIGKPKRVALFVGVNDYEDRTIPHLNGAVADAEELHRFFASRKNQFDKALLLRNPKSREILDKVRELSEGLSEGDFFMFYFAGHGVVEGNRQKLLCSDTQVWNNTPLGDFNLEIITDVRKWNVAVLLDACRTSLSTSRGVSGPRVGSKRDLAFYDGLVKSRGEDEASLTVLFSCDEGKTAGETANGKHGLFTLALLNVLEESDRNGRAWCFDQNLGDEIGRAMRCLADSESGGNMGQRPWIKASGTPPLFFLPTLDLKPLKDWTKCIEDEKWLTEKESLRCQAAVIGESSNPGAKGIFETIRFFSDWANSRKDEEVPKETASVILKAFCNSDDSVAPYAERREALALTDADEARPLGQEDSMPLTQDERRRIEAVVCAVCPSWREDAEISQNLGKLRNARTSRDAIEAVRAIRETILFFFETKNARARQLMRLDPFFQYRAGSVLAELERIGEPFPVDAALLSLFHMAKVYCANFLN